MASVPGGVLVVSPGIITSMTGPRQPNLPGRAGFFFLVHELKLSWQSKGRGIMVPCASPAPWLRALPDPLGAAMRAQLLPLENGSPIDLVKDLTVVGRTETCDVRLDHKSVSKLHCVIVKTDGLLLLRDLGSTNGTRVNGQRVRRAALLPNDQLTIATYKFKVIFGPDALPSPARPDENTQQIEARELAQIIHKAGAQERDSEVDMPAAPPVRTNLLPDVYPE
jgi:hypothetical protein